jgi:hypothetical protein
MPIVICFLLACSTTRQALREKTIEVSMGELNKINETIDVLIKILAPERIKTGTIQKYLRGQNPDTFFLINLISSDTGLLPKLVVLTSDIKLHGIQPNRKFNFSNVDTLKDTVLINALKNKIDKIDKLMDLKMEEPFNFFKCQDGFFSLSNIYNSDTNVYIMDGVYMSLFNKNLLLVGR